MMDSSKKQDGIGGSCLFYQIIVCNPKETHHEMDRHVSYRLYRVHRWCSSCALENGSFGIESSVSKYSIKN